MGREWSDAMPTKEFPRTPNPLAVAVDRFPWWISTTVIVGSLLMLTGAILAIAHPVSLVSPTDQINGAVRIYAGYLFSRNLALAIMLLASLASRAGRWLAGLMLLTALVQVLDAGLDLLDGRVAVAPAAAILGIAFLLGSVRLAGHPFWNREAWGT
jgi:hypothetical protein